MTPIFRVCEKSYNAKLLTDRAEKLIQGEEGQRAARVYRTTAVSERKQEHGEMSAGAKLKATAPRTIFRKQIVKGDRLAVSTIH